MLDYLERSVAAFYTTDPDIKKQILTHLDHLIGVKIVALNKLHDLETILTQRSVSLLIMEISANASQIHPEQEFDRILEFMPKLKRRHPYCQVILITSAKLSLKQSCKAVIEGVTACVDRRQQDFRENLREHLLAAHDYFNELISRRRVHELSQRFDKNSLVGSSDALADVVKLARRAARVSDAPVVIYGESGTGKQRLAEIIHELDEKRSAHEFVCVNCAAITGSLAESELFGHKKGAFTGATEDRKGYFLTADRGTILLDEISELSLALQPKILRVLQEGLVLSVGSDKECRVDVRVIAATNRDLKKMVNAGNFRLDLYQRLNVIQLKVPSLSQRKEDIPALFKSFLKKYAHYSHCHINSVDPQVYDVLAYSVGTGNIRELENIVRQILVFKERGRRIEITDLPNEIIQKGVLHDSFQVKVDVPVQTVEALARGKKKLMDAVDEYEKIMLTRLINRGISQTLLAGRLGITRRTLYNKLQKYDLR